MAIAATALLLAKTTLAQPPPPHFEVAVIRPSPADAVGTSVNLFEGGRVRIVNEPVKLLVRMAFALQNAQIAGGPPWLETDRYDIEAKTGRPEKTTPGQLRPLMRSLLEERFNLKFHHETRELTVYALMAAKSGPKLKAATEDEASGTNSSGGGAGPSQLIATATSMELLAGYVGNRLGQIVLDKTGLAGAYDFTLKWTSDETPNSPAPSLVTALREQLGLRVETQKHPVEVLVIDNLDKPSEN
jgi:uncharacterized protein (TIGR03435 family)